MAASTESSFGEITNSRGMCVYSSVQFSSVQGGIYALGKAHVRSTPSLVCITKKLEKDSSYSLKEAVTDGPTTCLFVEPGFVPVSVVSADNNPPL